MPAKPESREDEGGLAFLKHRGPEGADAILCFAGPPAWGCRSGATESLRRSRNPGMMREDLRFSIESTAQVWGMLGAGVGWDWRRCGEEGVTCAT